MKKVSVNYLKTPELENPILIEGLPGIGHVGKLVAAHLIEELDCELFAEISSFYFPPAVAVRNGLVEPIRIKFYYSTDPDLIIIIGDSQASSAEGHYYLADKILEIAENCGASKVITLGGFGIGKTVSTPKLYGAATDQDLIEKYKRYGVKFNRESKVSSIVGAAGLLLGLAKDRNMKGVSILSETMGPPLMIDPKAAKSVLEVLSKVLNLEVDISRLDEKAKRVKKKVRKVKKKVPSSLLKKGKETSKELWYIG